MAEFTTMLLNIVLVCVVLCLGTKGQLAESAVNWILGRGLLRAWSALRGVGGIPLHDVDTAMVIIEVGGE